jgi:hypothetical protein
MERDLGRVDVIGVVDGVVGGIIGDKSVRSNLSPQLN